jgi:hypothetical protein
MGEKNKIRKGVTVLISKSKHTKKDRGFTGTTSFVKEVSTLKLVNLLNEFEAQLGGHDGFNAQASL